MMHTDVYFRLDASSSTGGGHLSRSLALARCIVEKGASVEFLCVQLDAPYVEALVSNDYKFTVLHVADGLDAEAKLEADAKACAGAISDRRQARKILVVDHYQISRPWELAVRAAVNSIVVIDDLANRRHDCDLLLDQAYGETGARYLGLIPAGCVGLFGTRYALLRPEFAKWRRNRGSGTLTGDTDLIVHTFFGSEDVGGNALRFAPLVLEIKGVREVRVAVSPHFQYMSKLDDLRRHHDGRLTWRVAGASMAEHMAGCDIAFGAPGQATWERACLGLPAVYVAISKNQVQILERLAAEEFCVFLGIDRALSDDDFLVGFSRFVSDRRGLAAMQAKSMSVVDGLGSSRVADAVLSLGRCQ